MFVLEKGYKLSGHGLLPFNLFNGLGDTHGFNRIMKRIFCRCLIKVLGFEYVIFRVNAQEIR